MDARCCNSESETEFIGVLPLGGRIGALSERGWPSVLREDSECHYLKPPGDVLHLKFLGTGVVVDERTIHQITRNNTKRNVTNRYFGVV